MTAKERITNHIEELGDWRGDVLARLRRLIREASPDLIEEWKWNTPVWSYNGNVVAAGAFQDHVKVNFFKGSTLDDPQHLFNAGFEAKSSRAIDLHARDRINEAALTDLVRAAVGLNSGKNSKRSTGRAKG